MAVLLSSRLAAAQQLPAGFYSVEPERRVLPQAGSVPAQRGVGWPIVGGLLAGSAGFWAGAFIAGAIADKNCDGEDVGCLLHSILAGAAIGESLLLPAGIHVGNGRRGTFPLELGASVGLAGLGVAAAEGADDPWPLVPAAVAQMVVGVLLERRTRTP
jgi:hypothetical protein